MGPDPAPVAAPYRDAAHTYRAAGWVGVLPVPYRTKKLRATGWTGHQGAWPSGADIHEWCNSDRHDEGGGNIALRLPPDVIGIDVDNYDGKHGAETLADAVATWGPLPDTWMSSARDDGISKIRLFRIPEGLRWPGQLGPHVEIIQTSHRYMVVWPSVHPVAGTYRWYRPDGLPTFAPPRVDELPNLPDPWIAGLTAGEVAEDIHIADLSTKEVADWLAARPAGAMCRGMEAVVAHLVTGMEGGAHEALRHLMAIVRFAEQGHTGLAAALNEARTAFLNESTNPSRHGAARTQGEAQSEWLRSLTGAVRRVRGDASVAEDDDPLDPCDTPFAGLVTPTPAAAGPLPPAPAVALTPLQARQQAALTGEHPTPNIHTESPGEGPGVPNPTPHAATHSDSDGHTSWWPKDLTAILSGDYTEPEPDVLARADGHHLFYSGKVNGLLGESESGKSFLLLAAAVQQLHAGQPVLYVDFEDTADSVVARLLAMGCDPGLLAPDKELFDYVAPDESLHAVAAADLHHLLGQRTYSLIGLDGYNAAMTLLGLDLSSNTDATKFSQSLLRPLARTGAAVVTVDHVGKNAEMRGKGGIGAQAKRAMVTGAAYTVEVLSPFGRGQTGKLKLTVDKDRPGHVRGFAENSKNAGIATLESGSNGSVNVRVDPSGSPGAAASARPEWRPTSAMEKISRLLSTTDGMLSQRQIEAAVDLRAVTIRQALEGLIAGGYVSRHAGPRNSLLHRYEKTYREFDDLVVDAAGEADDDRNEW